MKQDVDKFIKKYDLFSGGETVIVAVSGGPDSMALLEYLWSMRSIYKIKVFAAHAHHQLRGREADEDEAFIEDYCQSKGISLFKTRLEVKEYAKSKRIGTQTAARELRYSWFDSLLPDTPNRYIATGHHGDDQIETMLMKLIRGTIPFHLSGMAVKRKIGDSVIIRPFLGITKQQIEQYCKEVKINSRLDSSNQSTVYTRNRFRFQLLPFIKGENQQAHLHIHRQSEWMEDDQQLLMELAEQALETIVIQKSEQMFTISREAFLQISVPLQRRLIHLILKYISGKNSPIITSIHIEQIIALLTLDAPSKELHIANDVFVYRDYEVCHFSWMSMITGEEVPQVLDIPGEVKTKLGVVKAYWTNEICSTQNREHLIILDANAVKTPLMVRTRLAGDRLAGQGMDGTKKLNRLFIDRKISKYLREQWPIIVDGDGAILWVPLLHRTRLAAISSQTTKWLVLSFSSKDEILNK